ncbi:uncharacterized protein LOC127725487 [Mytilus californianus]|uniref:uncharacterized protein LOC127725487 n=1 Tax=Mytilus californianus TaxID=6549 RepID=UPI002247E27E|nr:uncharacterized protein LOC127725487 [Mytilus californianus]
MPSKPTDQEANIFFDEKLASRERNEHISVTQHTVESEVESLHDDSQDDGDERMNDSIRKEKHNPNEQKRFSTNSNSNINQCRKCYTSRSDKTVSPKCSGSNPIHIASVHKSEEEVDNVIANKHIEREEKQTEEKNDETNGLLAEGTNTKKYSNRPSRMISVTCTKLQVVIVGSIAIVCLALVIAVILLFIRIKTIQGHKRHTSSEISYDINSFTLHVNWNDIETVNSKQNVNITWFPVKQNKFMNVERDIININLNGTYDLYLSLNIDIPKLKENASNESIRNISLICLKTNRYENLCQRHRSFPNTASTVPIKGVFPLWEGDKIWVSVIGMNQIYQSRANNRLVITKYPLGIYN